MDAFENLERRLENQKELYMSDLTGGRCEDFAAYKNVCGIIRGLSLAQSEIQDLAKQLRESDD